MKNCVSGVSGVSRPAFCLLGLKQRSHILNTPLCLTESAKVEMGKKEVFKRTCKSHRAWLAFVLCCWFCLHQSTKTPSCHLGVMKGWEVTKQVWWALTCHIGAAVLLAGVGRLAVKCVSPVTGAKGELPVPRQQPGLYQLQQSVSLQISCWVRAAETFHLHRHRGWENAATRSLL